MSVILDEDQKVINSVSNFKPDATQAKKPKVDAKYLKTIEVETLREVLALGPDAGRVTINHQSLLVYQYRKDDRQLQSQGPSESGHHRTLTLTLKEVPDSIQDGTYCVVREVLFTLPLPAFGSLNWQTFVEVETGVVLYLRAVTASIATPVTGSLYTLDPITRNGSSAPLPESDITILNALRQKIPLSNLTTTNPQALKGKYAEIKLDDATVVESPRIIPTSTNNDFDGDVQSDLFAAVNGFRHITRLFELVVEVGAPMNILFQNVTWPLPVYHRSLGNLVDAQAPSNELRNGSGGFKFGRAAGNSKIGIAADFRVAAHEFGHALLYTATKSPDFSFAHSPGDSIAAIFCDLGSQAPDRYESFPWTPWVERSHGRKIADGWAWGGIEFLRDDSAMYHREQILSTSLFRLYLAIGGDARDNITKQTWASRYTLYLIFTGIAGINQPAPTPDTYVSSMIKSDGKMILNSPGGAVRKVIRWAFEKQGLYQLERAPSPVVKEGAPPQVDVYIDDGRKGEYGYVANFDTAPGIWVRQSADGVQTHQTPVVNTINYVYVTIHNRGSLPAHGIQVKAYASKIAGPQIWDAQLTQFAELSLATPNNVPAAISAGSSAIAGPFTWNPFPNSTNRTLLMSVSAQADLSNIDPTNNVPCAKGPIDLDKLVPFDNNLAMRRV